MTNLRKKRWRWGQTPEDKGVPKEKSEKDERQLQNGEGKLGVKHLPQRTTGKRGQLIKGKRKFQGAWNRRDTN